MTPGSRPSSFALCQPGPLRLYNTTELLKLPSPEWLVDGILPANGFIGLYGPSGAGKSFVAIDLAMCVASGKAWRGHEVKQGLVVYVSAEGGPGISKRARAWLSQNEVKPHEARMAWLIESIKIGVFGDQNGADPTSLTSDINVLIQRLDDDISEKPVLVILDTLARCLEGDENATRDMGAFISELDRLRLRYDCAVMPVHHTGWDETRERGNKSFRNAADTMLSCAGRKTKADPVVLSCNKQKDAEEFEPMYFDLKQVTVGQDERGQPQTSCILIGNQDLDTTILAIIGENTIGFRELLGAVQAQAHTHAATVKRRLVRLVQSGKIIREKGQYWKAGRT